MRRRSRAGGEPTKARHRKEVVQKRLNAPRVRGRATGRETEIACLTHERDEAREQQKATAEILRSIRTSPADVRPVFEMIVQNAVSLCGSLYANVNSILFRSALCDSTLRTAVPINQEWFCCVSVPARVLALSNRVCRRPLRLRLPARAGFTKSSTMAFAYSLAAMRRACG